MNKLALSPLEKRSISALAAIFGLRMFGLFLILPVLSIYSNQIEGSTPFLIGLAMGIYGITQAILQIPFGILSDHFGRKKIITLGLIIFAIGSIVAGLSTHITGVIIGRALQGAGAIAAVVLALTADLTREDQRTKAMAFIGMSIGLAFMLALMGAPLLEPLIGVQGMFFMTAILSLLAIILLWKVVPTPVQAKNLDVKAVPSQMLKLLFDKQLLRLDLGIFSLHFVLTAMFVVVPIILFEQLDLATNEHWQIYIPALLLSVLFMIPLIIISTKRRFVMPIFFAAICILLIAQLLLLLLPLSWLGMMFCMFVFFWGFNTLEAMLPSLVSQVAPAQSKGSAMGVYNTFQFMGVFLGGVTGGLLYGEIGFNGVFIVCALLLLVWGILTITAPKPDLFHSYLTKLPDNDSKKWLFHLSKVKGVKTVTILAEDNTAYLKIDKSLFDAQSLRDVLNS